MKIVSYRTRKRLQNSVYQFTRRSDMLLVTQWLFHFAPLPEFELMEYERWLANQMVEMCRIPERYLN